MHCKSSRNGLGRSRIMPVRSTAVDDVWRAKWTVGRSPLGSIACFSSLVNRSKGRMHFQNVLRPSLEKELRVASTQWPCVWMGIVSPLRNQAILHKGWIAVSAVVGREAASANDMLLGVFATSWIFGSNKCPFVENPALSPFRILETRLPHRWTIPAHSVPKALSGSWPSACNPSRKSSQLIRLLSL